jgi:SAM-dependent methyltransferase
MMSLVNRSGSAWVQYVRSLELAGAARFLEQASGRKLLEIGGADGFLAKQMSMLGFEVTSIDVAPKVPQHYPVQNGSVTNLEFPDGSFDVIFSSHVIAHIRDKAPAFREMKRVLTANGIGVHIVPSTWWSLVSNFWHFILLPGSVVKRLFRGKREQAIPGCESPSQSDLAIPGADSGANEKPLQSKMNERVRQMLLHPLGEHPSFLHEIIFFSRWYWTRLFQQNGFSVLRIQGGPLLQSGYRLFPFRAVKSRRILARCMPSSLVLFTRPMRNLASGSENDGRDKTFVR